MEEAGSEGCNLSKMGQVSWWYFPQENDRRAATESRIITYTQSDPN